MPGSTRWVSDAIVDLLVEAGVRHVSFNPGASFRGLHDSLAHRVDGPQVVLCTHEATSVAMAHGYAKASGRIGVALLHDVVGLQNASMAIYNAWCDRVPLLLIGGTGPVSTPKRRPWIDWIHTANVQAEQVRHYVKWDDQPADAASIPRALARCLRMAEAEPPGPVYLCLDAALQEEPLDGAVWPSLSEFPTPTWPAAPEDELDALAERLRQATLPVFITDYTGDRRAGFNALRTLAELVHAPVIDGGARHNFPVDHPLNFSELPEILPEADLVVAFEVDDLFAVLARCGRGGPAGVIHVAAGHLRVRSWAHDVGELPALERLITATAPTALSGLVRRLEDEPVPSEAIAARRRLAGDRASARRQELWATARSASGAAGTLPPARLAALTWDVLAEHDPMLVHSRPTDWERRLWPLQGFGSHLGWHGGGGLGYGLGASIGAALALEDTDRLLVNLQPDGDLLYAPSALWTAAHLSLPLLVLVHNNRQYRNTVEHAARLGVERRDSDSLRYAGAGMTDPPVDFAALARALGVWAIGPVSAVDEVAPALAEAVGVVRSGRPAVVEFLTSGA